MKWWKLAALLVMLAGPLSAQVGSWKYESTLHDNVRNIPLAGVLVVTFDSTGTWRSMLATDDGSGELGHTALATGFWRMAKDPFDGEDELCVKWTQSRYASCFTLVLTDSTLHWSGMDMDRISAESADKFFNYFKSTE